MVCQPNDWKGEKKMESKKWIEIFSQGDIWELESIGSTLYAERMDWDFSERYDDEEIADNGISGLGERARLMGLALVVMGE